MPDKPPISPVARLAALRDLPNDSPVKTLAVALLLSLVCSVLVSTTAVLLKPVQEQNRAAARKKTILEVAGLMQPGRSIGDLFKQVEPRLVNFASGDYVSGIDPAGYDQRAAAADPQQGVAVDPAADPAKIRRRARQGLVYLVRDGAAGGLRTLILPIRGYGLWSTLYGYLALAGDGRTIQGIVFYEHQETPGLGAEVDNPAWRAQWPGKLALDPDGEVRIRLVKGGVNSTSADAPYQVDALSGATLTSNGVTNMLQYWLGGQGYGPYLAKIREREG